MKEQNDLGDTAEDSGPGSSGVPSSLRSDPASQALPIPIAHHHTPGPWYVTEGPTYGFNSTLKVESYAKGTEAYGMVICTRNITTEGSEIDKLCRANAKLIAAAPDMLKALRSARDKVASAAAVDACKWTIDLLKITDHVRAQCAEIDAAIAKATAS